MRWCPRCDELTGGRAGDECPSCGAEILDATPLTTSRNARHVLELERVSDPITTGQPIATVAYDDGSSRILRRAFGSRSLKVGLAAAILAGSAFSALHAGRDTEPKSKFSPTPTATPLVEPPLGNPHKGSVAIAFHNGLRFISLADGSTVSIDPTGGVNAFAVSPSGKFVAHADSTRLLTVTRIASKTAVPVATEVDFFAWDPEESMVLVARRQLDARERERWRLESISLETREPALLLETDHVIMSIFSRGGRILFELHDDEGYPNVYELRGPNSARLLRKRAALLDVSPDGTLALIARRDGAGVFVIDTTTRRARQIGSSKLWGLSARISSDGSRAALVGSTSSAMAQACDHEGPCPAIPFAENASLQTVDLETLDMRELLAASAAELGRPAWGPFDAWLFFFSGEQPVAVSLGTPNPIPIGSNSNVVAWIPLEYVP